MFFFPVANCDGTGIPTTTDKLATLTSIGNLWNAQTSKSLEMWLYSGENSTDRQVRWVTANGQYMFQAAIHDQKLWVELYTLEADGAALNITLTNQAVADVSHIPLQTWSHLVAQSTDFTTAEWTLYLDGKKLTLSNPANAPTYPFSWEIAPGPTVPEDDLAVLKHVRLYNRSLSDGEVAANYRNSCLSPVGLPAGTPMDLWARFNIPAPGSETTTGDGSTNEFVNRFIVPQHGLPSNYVFNSFNKVIRQVSPDGGTTEFWYDKLSRLVASQNSEQKVPTDPADPANRYSFTKYDALGRIREVGEKTAGIDITTINLSNQTELSSWYAQGTDRSLTQTVYDANPVDAPAGAILENLRHRVSASIFRETRAAQKINATYFSYDISGNAKTVYQEIGELKALDNTTGIKKLEYDFDLVSGKVNMLTYQKDKGDQFFYKFEYDADNRIKAALTSRDGSNDSWNLEARYSYYLHGPLARVELGKNEVQGIDYAYTLSGWLKAINGKDLIPGDDMGGDGTTVSAAKNFSRDELAFTLGYFNGDYAPIGGQNANAISRKFEPEVFPAQTPYAGTGAPLFNGNISNSTVHMAPEILGAAKGYTYRYDQLNRLLTMRQHTGLPTGHGSIWNKTSGTDDYKESITYDANGNILSFLRNSSGAAQMDALTYHYNKDAKGNLLNNKLRHVGDMVSASAFAADIDDQPVDNYAYDKIGNLISDVSEGLQKVKWTPYGKINSIQKANNVIQYEYDATGNRVWKSSNNAEKRTYYVRDPQGNVLAVYNYDAPSGSGGQGGTLSWAEQHLYGSNRLGLLTPAITVTQNWQYPQDGPNSFVEGKRTYELTNHLGNVLATINDKKIAVDQDNNGINDYFRAELLSVTDYYSFGMQMPGRKWSLSSYRYGFNGQEKSDEIKGEGNSYTAEFWEYDPRIGRRWNVDPVTDETQSPFVVFDNNPIVITDIDGDCTDCPDESVKSKYLDWAGIDMGSFGNGIADGLIGTFTGIGEFVWDMSTSSEARSEFMEGMQQLITNPIETIKLIAADKFEKWSSVLSGNGTEEDKYAVGNDIGSVVGGLITGAGMKKLVELLKVARAEKNIAKIAEAADNATPAGKPAPRGSRIHSKFEKTLKSQGKNAEVSYIDGKVVKRNTSGSTRADAIYGKKTGKPKIAYDLKTGKSGISKDEKAMYKKNLPKGTKLKEVSKDKDGKYKVKKVKM